jgi:hypothetical protein
MAMPVSSHEVSMPRTQAVAAMELIWAEFNRVVPQKRVCKLRAAGIIAGFSAGLHVADPHPGV